MTHELNINKEILSEPLRPLTVEEQMLRSTEILHYADKFRGRTFACIVGQTNWLGDFFLDLKVFYLAHIQMMICCVYRPWLKNQITEWNTWGYAMDYFEASNTDLTQLSEEIKNSLSNQRLPVIAIKDTSQIDLPPSNFHDDALKIAAAAGANRAFILGSAEGIIINERLLSHISSKDALNVSQQDKINVSYEMLNYLIQKHLQYNLELVVLKAGAGSMYQEVFTHIGIGTLFSDTHKIQFRTARLHDARDIAFIMRPYVQKNIMLPISEDSIVQDIESFHVYTINDDVVAVGRLSDYGESYELGKLATLPRYRRKGLARSLIDELIKFSKEKGKKYIFSLTVEPKAMELFLSAGFKEVDRKTLPESWQVDYDFSRPSKAYRFDL